MTMLKVALTGGIGTGKSDVLARFASRGVPTIDADRLARAALAPGAPAVARVLARFGPGVSDAEGRIDRRALGAIVFGDEAARRDLEAIVHPVVLEAVDRWFAELMRAGRQTLGIADVPLLYEAGLEGRFDRVVVAACDPKLQFHRVMARDRLTDREVRARLSAQRPMAHKIARADFVIHTDGTFSETEAQVAAVLSQLEGLAQNGLAGAR